MIIRIASVAVGVIALTVGTVALADTILLTPIADGIASDDRPFDGRADRLFEAFGNRVSFLPGEADQRAVIHFDINSVKGLRVLKATLKLVISHKELSQSTIFPIEVRGYNSAGVLKHSDFHEGAFVTVFDGVATPFGTVAINVTERVKRGLISPSGFIGFTLRTNMKGTVTFSALEDGAVVHPKLVVVTE